MFYTRGSIGDFDRYAALTNDVGWSWNQMFPYFLKNEKWTPPADLHNTFGQFNPALHNTHGMTEVSLSGYAWPLGPLVIQATEELPDFPFNLDPSSGRPLGISWRQATIGGGERSTSATSYLSPQFARRPNLHVLLHARATLLKSKTVGSNVKFTGVQFLHPDSGSPIIVSATKEIILSAGTVGTPHLLMHSGVGPKESINALGIPSVLDLPSVGQNVSDHPSVGLSWTVNSTQTLESLTQNITAFNQAFAQWNHSHTGPFVDIGATHVGWFRLDANVSIFQNYSDPSADPGSPHIEMIFSAGISGSAPPGNHLSIGIIVVTPTSRGTITLNSSNPLDPPLINPGFLTTDFDMFTARAALQRAQRFVTAPVFKDYVLAPVVDISNFTQNQLDQFIRNNAHPVAHLVGSAAVSPRGASYGVVDPDFRVKGATGLRVIDAAVLPIVPSAHTQAPTYALAERGADLIKASWA